MKVCKNEGMPNSEILHCQLGDHEWERPRVRGAKPKNCPEHAPYVPGKRPSTPEEEERQALRKAADAERRRKQAEAARRVKLAKAITETGRKYPECRCNLTSKTTIDKIATMRSCTDPRWVCTRLDSIRREFASDVHEVYSAMLRRPDYDPSEIKDPV